MKIKISRYFLFLLLSLVVLSSASLAIKNPFLTKAMQPFPTIDKIPELAKQAEIIKKGEPTPLWQNRLSENDLDELLLIPGQGLLGRLVIEPKFIKSTPFSNGLAKVYQNGVDSYIDKSGNTVKPPYNLQEAGNPALCEGLKPHIPGNKWLEK